MLRIPSHLVNSYPRPNTQQQQQGVCIFSCIFAQRVALDGRDLGDGHLAKRWRRCFSTDVHSCQHVGHDCGRHLQKALQATSTTTSGGVLINRVLAHHIQHSTFATCVHYLRQAAEADQVGQGRVHCICCRKTNSCRFGHGRRFDG